MKAAVLLQAALASAGLAMNLEGLVSERASVPACFDSEYAVLCGAVGACTQDNPSDTSTIQSLCGVDCSRTYDDGQTNIHSICNMWIAKYTGTLQGQCEGYLWTGGAAGRYCAYAEVEAANQRKALGSGADCFYALLKRYRHCVDCCGS
ncbi:hypothetical protein G3M48_007230 [Beauveria asiatica]|uniref:Uncharacterized protein n=1 Tax=Beauveria asiatica TaxID=1069075 RepID=A0AAW0RNP7_9HYPO